MHYHLIGIGGTSMAGIAQVLQAAGNTVSGTDSRTTGHGPHLVPPGTDVVIYTEAISPGSPGYEELAHARARHIPTLRRIEFIAQSMREKTGIAIAGAHGKSTTTALIGWILSQASLDPTVFIGADLPAFNGSARAGEGAFVVTEACEWNRQFLMLHPAVLVLTTLDREHLDTYPGGTDDILAAFRQAIGNTDPDGRVVANIDDPLIRTLLKGASRRIVPVGYASDAEYRILSSEQTSDGRLGVSVRTPNGSCVYLVSSLVGTHHAVNVTAALAVADYVGVPLTSSMKAITSFPGLKRRFERYREDELLTIVDDYAHHPTEILATVVAAKHRYPNRRLVVVFQPHLSERTTELFAEFLRAFSEADLVLVAETYEPAGRMVPADARTSADLVRALRDRGVRSEASGSVEETSTLLASRIQKGDVLMTVGATAIWKVAEAMKSWGIHDR